MGNLTKTKIFKKNESHYLTYRRFDGLVRSNPSRCSKDEILLHVRQPNQTNKSRRLQAVATGYNVPAWCPALGNAKSNDACAHVSVDGRRRRLQAMITCPAYQGNVCQPNTNNRMEC